MAYWLTRDGKEGICGLPQLWGRKPSKSGRGAKTEYWGGSVKLYGSIIKSVPALKPGEIRKVKSINILLEER